MTRVWPRGVGWAGTPPGCWGLAEIAEDAGVNISALRMSADTHLFLQTALDRVHWLIRKHGPWTLRGLEEAARAARVRTWTCSTRPTSRHPSRILWGEGGHSARRDTPAASQHHLPPPQAGGDVELCSTHSSHGPRPTGCSSGREERSGHDAGCWPASPAPLLHCSERRRRPLPHTDRRGTTSGLPPDRRPARSIMWVGPFKRHKNLEALIQAYALLPDTLRSEVSWYWQERTTTPTAASCPPSPQN